MNSRTLTVTGCTLETFDKVQRLFDRLNGNPHELSEFLFRHVEICRLGYLAGIAAATPEQLDELRELCRPQEGA